MATSRVDERFLFGAHLRQTMKRRGMNFTDLREFMGVDKTTFNSWLKDRGGNGRPEIPTDDQVRDIAAWLDIREEFLLGLAERARRALGETVESAT